MFEHRELDAVAALLHLAPTSPDSLRPGLALLHGWIRMSSRYTSSADTHAMVARIAPSILELLEDGIPRSRRAFVAALANRYSKEEVELTLMRLAVTGQILAASGKYTLAPTPEPEQG